MIHAACHSELVVVCPGVMSELWMCGRVQFPISACRPLGLHILTRARTAPRLECSAVQQLGDKKRPRDKGPPNVGVLPHMLAREPSSFCPIYALGIATRRGGLAVTGVGGTIVLLFFCFFGGPVAEARRRGRR